MKSQICNVRNYVLIVVFSLFYNCIMLLYEQMPRMVVVFISFLYAMYLYNKFIKHFTRVESLFLCTILFVPTYKVSIFGDSFKSTPVSWFHVLVLLTFVLVVFRYRVKPIYCVLIITFIGYAVTISLYTYSFFDASKQIITILFFLIGFVNGYCISRAHTNDLKSFVVKVYTLSTISFSLQIFFQKVVISYTGTIIGTYGEYGSDRIAYAGLLSDYSLASVFLASGCMIVFIQFISYKKLTFMEFIFLELFLLSSILIVTARTGILSLGVVIILYLLCNFRRYNNKTIVLSVLGLVVAPFFYRKLMSSRGGQPFFDSSGRIENYIQAFGYIKDEPITGMGLGLNNMMEKYAIIVPHNFFIQYLLQLGITGVLIFIFFFIEYLKDDLNKNDDIRWVLYLIFVAAMFIPDIFSSRFFYVILVMCTIPSDVTVKIREK